MSDEWAWVAACYAAAWIVLIGYATYVARRAAAARIANQGPAE